MNRFLKLLNEKSTLLLDGAMGTNLFSNGLESGDAPELWNLSEAEKICRHYRSFIEVGSDLVLTNSFGGNGYRLRLHNSEEKIYDINFEAAKLLVSEIKKSGKSVVAAGSMGPTGEILEPNGQLTIENAAEAYAAQAIALKDGGVDVIWIETCTYASIPPSSSIEEATAAVMGAKETNLPIVLTMSIDSNGRTMMGVTPSEIRILQSQLPEKPTAFGANCGIGAAEVIAAIINMQIDIDLNSTSPILVAKGNCGIPEWVDGHICYSGTPELMANYAAMAIDAGARLIGGCCGTTPAHVAAMREAIDTHNKKSRPTMEEIESKLGKLCTGTRAQMQGDVTRLGGAASERSPRKRNRSRNRKSNLL